MLTQICVHVSESDVCAGSRAALPGTEQGIWEYGSIQRHNGTVSQPVRDALTGTNTMFTTLINLHLHYR